MNDKIIELIKWFITSVSLVVVTIIVDSGFKDRETGIEEMNIYNQYVDIILQSDNIEQRYRLVEYFSIVTPTQRLRERWNEYKNVIQPDYMEYKRLKHIEEMLTSMEEVSQDSIKVIHNKMETIGGSMIKKGDIDLALEYEKKGCQALVDKNIEDAIEYFSLSEKSLNGFHSSYEIALYLKKNKDNITKNGDWNKVYSDILEKYSWKLPKEYLTLFKN
jgi:hypothetical protein